MQQILRPRSRELYRQKEIEFPVQAAHGRFHGRQRPAGRPAARSTTARGCIRWARDALQLAEDGTHPRRLPHAVAEPIAGSRSSTSAASVYPATSEEEIDAKLEEAFEGTEKVGSRGRRRDRRTGSRDTYGIEIPAEALTG